MLGRWEVSAAANMHPSKNQVKKLRGVVVLITTTATATAAAHTPAHASQFGRVGGIAA